MQISVDKHVCTRMAASYDFFESNVPSEWRNVLQLYDQAIDAKAEKKTKPLDKKNLVILDKWYQAELPSIIQSRKERYINHEEICKLMTWKLMRGKFRPSLTKLIQSNAEDDVIKASKKAFQKLPDVNGAIKALTVLRGVGPATASAVLAAGAPECAAFMADEALKAVPGAYPTDYSLQSYMNYHSKIQACVNRLNKTDSDLCWHAHMVEKTLWTFVILNELKPDILSGVTEKSHKREPEEDVTKKVVKKRKK